MELKISRYRILIYNKGYSKLYPILSIFTRSNQFALSDYIINIHLFKGLLNIILYKLNKEINENKYM